MPLEILVQDSPITMKIVEMEDVRRGLSHPWRNSLYAVFIAEHIKLGDASKYKDWVQNLPKDLSSYPTFFTDTEKDYFQDSTFPVRKITERKAQEANDYLVIKKSFPEFEDEITYDEFKAAKILANLRAFEMTFTDNTMRPVLVPFIEFAAINFGNEPNVQMVQQDGRTKLKVTKEIKKGGLITLLPNIASNVNVLINTGFTLPNNPHECTDIHITFDESASNFALKLELMGSPGNMFNYQLRNDFRHPQSMEIFSFLRYVCFDEDEGYLLLTRNQTLEFKKKMFMQRGGKEDQWNPAGMFNGSEMNFCTKRCERNAMNELTRLCQGHLSRFPTTLEEDTESLQKDR